MKLELPAYSNFEQPGRPGMIEMPWSIAAIFPSLNSVAGPVFRMPSIQPKVYPMFAAFPCCMAGFMAPMGIVGMLLLENSKPAAQS